MIVLVDTNVFLSYLISSQSDATVRTVVDKILDEEIALIFLPEIESELRRTVAEKPYFIDRVATEQVDQLIALLYGLTNPPPAPIAVNERWVRDPKDDYLIHAALQSGVEYLITGDKDLLALDEGVVPFRIRSPQGFLDELASDQSSHVD